MTDYKTIFSNIEATLLDVGSRNLSRDKIIAELETYKHYAGKRLTDDEYYRNLVHIVFYSGFRASTVSAKLHVIDRHFPDYSTAAIYGNKEIEAIMHDGEMIRNRAKIAACVDNAKAMKKAVEEFGAFSNFVLSLPSAVSDASLISLRNKFKGMFKFLGDRVAFHFMMDIGLDVLKPDRVIERIFKRLELVNDKLEGDQLYVALIQQGRRFSSATGYPIRYIDIVFVAYGQMQSDELGIREGICLEEKPSCSICRANSYCSYYKKAS